MTPEQQQALEPLKGWLAAGLAHFGVKPEQVKTDDDFLYVEELGMCLSFPDEQTLDRLVLSHEYIIHGVRYYPDGSGADDATDYRDIVEMPYDLCKVATTREIVRRVAQEYNNIVLDMAFETYNADLAMLEALQWESDYAEETDPVTPEDEADDPGLDALDDEQG